MSADAAFFHAPSPALMCPLCKGLLTSPVISITCGHSFCQSCVAGAKACTHDNTALGTVIPNIALAMQLNDIECVCALSLIHI